MTRRTQRRLAFAFFALAAIVGLLTEISERLFSLL